MAQTQNQQPSQPARIIVERPGGPPTQSPEPSEKVMRFFNAITDHDTNRAAEMLESDTNLAQPRNIYGKLPLLEAAAAGNVPLVKRLIELGADIDGRGDTWNSGNLQLTALHAAVWYGHPDVCKFLLEAGANPNLQSAMNGTPLHYAFEYRQPEMANWLLDYGADPFLEKKNAYNKPPPFDFAIAAGDGTLVPRMLGQDRAHPLAKNIRSKAVKPRSRADFERAVAKIIQDRGNVLVGAAARRGQLESVQGLIKAGATASGLNDEGVPIFQGFAVAEAGAARSPNFNSGRWSQIQDLLIKHGADYDVFAATAQGDLPRARTLLSADKNLLQARDKDGQTPLHWAVQNEQPQLTSFWLEAGIPIGATNAAGQIALHLAAARGSLEQIRILQAANAPTDVRDKDGRTPMDVAVQAKQQEAIRMLLEAGGPAVRTDRGVSTSLHKAAESGNIVLISALTETATNLETRNELGLTPFQLAVTHGHLAAAAMLADKGANVNAKDADGNNTLQILLLNGAPMMPDVPTASWLKQKATDAQKEAYAKYIPINPERRGSDDMLRLTGFLLLCGLDVKNTNHAGKSAVDLTMDEQAGFRVHFFGDEHERFLKLLREGGGTLETRDANDDTPLHLAGRDLTADRAAALIASGADLNATNKQGRTPLHKFAEHVGAWGDSPDTEPFQLLLKIKPNVNARDNEGLTPLGVLALSDSSFKKEATKALLDAGADPNARDNQGRTPVDLFLSGSWPWYDASECIEMLTKAGADLSAKDNQGRTPLHYFAGLGDKSPLFIFRSITNLFIAAKVDIRARDNAGNMPIHVAARTGTKDVFDWLVKQGVSPDETNFSGETARVLAAHSTNQFSAFKYDSGFDIIQAVQRGRPEDVERLLKADPKLIDQTNVAGQTPLQMAVMFGKTNIVDFLDQRGVRWDAVSAVAADRADKLKEILKANPDVVNQPFMGVPLLHRAIFRGNAEIVQILLDHHASLTLVDMRGLSPLGLAIEGHRGEAANLLRRNGAVENIFDDVNEGNLPNIKALLAVDKRLATATNGMGQSPAEIATERDNVEVLKLLFETGAQPSTLNERSGGRTLLHVAALHNATNAAALLLRAKVGAEQRDLMGLTPLHLAAFNGSTGVAALLLKHKAAVDATVAAEEELPVFMPKSRWLNGCTALHLAALKGETNMIELLLKAGAAINAPNASGATPLDLASNPSRLSRLGMPEYYMLDPRHSSISQRFAGVSGKQKAAAALLEAKGGKRSLRRQSAANVP